MDGYVMEMILPASAAQIRMSPVVATTFHSVVGV
jgi:hypothetical protein